MPEGKTIIVGMCEIERKTHLDSINKLEDYIKELEKALLDIHMSIHNENYDMVNEIYEELEITTCRQCGFDMRWVNGDLICGMCDE
jgi:rubrerythrin